MIQCFFLFFCFFKSNLFKRQWSYFTLDDVSVIQSKSVKNMHFKNFFFGSEIQSAAVNKKN